jgi:hypothetical protein
MTLLLIIAIPVALVALAVFIGLRLPRTHVAASRIRLSATPEEVWNIITDFASHPTWRPGLAAVELGPAVDGCPSWYEICAHNTRVQFAVVRSVPPKRLVTRLVGEHLPLRGTWIYELAAHDDGTVLTITESDNIYNPLLRFFSKFVISYYGVMDVFLIALARRLGDDAKPEHLGLTQGNPT